MYINRVGSNTILQERSTECTVSYNYTCDLCQPVTVKESTELEPKEKETS